MLIYRQDADVVTVTQMVHVVSDGTYNIDILVLPFDGNCGIRAGFIGDQGTTELINIPSLPFSGWSEFSGQNRLPARSWHTSVLLFIELACVGDGRQRIGIDNVRVY